MRKLIYLIIFLFTIGSFAQGGPKVDVIKFRGEVTTTVRNTFNVPTGETWLIWNVTNSRLEVAGSDDVWTSASSGLGKENQTIPLLTNRSITTQDASSSLDFISPAGTLAKFKYEGFYHYGNLIMVGQASNTSILSFMSTDESTLKSRLGYSSAAPWSGFVFENVESGKKLTLLDTGILSYNGDMTIADDAYDAAGWNGNLEVPTKNAVRDKIEELVLTGGSGTVTSVAVSGSDGIEVDSGSPINTSGTIALGVNAATLRATINVENGADVTDTANVTSAGALMDSEVDADIKTLSLPASTTISAFGATLVDDINAGAARSTLGLGSLATVSSVGITELSATGTKSTSTVFHGDNVFRPVNSTSILDGTILNADINASAGILVSKLSSGAATEGQIITADGVGSFVIGDLAVESDHIVDGTISNIDIANGTIEANKLESTNSAVDGYFPSYDSATGGVTWESVGAGADSGSGYNFNAISTDDYTLDDEDVTNGGSATGKKIWNQFTTGQENIILDKDEITLVGNPFILQNFSSDSTLVKKADGTNFYIAEQSTAITEDGIILKNLHPVTAIKIDANSFFLQGNISVFTETSSSIMTDGNAANPTSEGNNATGFTDLGSGAPVSSATSPILGSYSIVYDAVSASGGEYMAYSLVGKVTNGQSITISFDYIAASTAQLTAWQGLSSTSTKTITADGLQHSYSETVTVSDESTAAIRWYPGTVAVAGWKIDNFIITVD